MSWYDDALDYAGIPDGLSDIYGAGEAISEGAKYLRPDWLDSGMKIADQADELDFLMDGPSGVLGKGMKGFGYAMDAISLFKGGMSLGEATTNDGTDANDDVEACDAVHDILAGGAGFLSNAGGEVGALATAFSGGFALGDFTADIADYGKGNIFGTDKYGAEQSSWDQAAEWGHDFADYAGNGTAAEIGGAAISALGGIAMSPVGVVDAGVEVVGDGIDMISSLF